MSEHQAEGNWNELYHSALGNASRNAVISGFEEHRERPHAESRAESGVEPEVALGFCTRQIVLHAVVSTAEYDVRFRARA